jgi:hypothetical protein
MNNDIYLGDGPSESVLTGIHIHSRRSKNATSLKVCPFSPFPPNMNILEPIIHAEWPYLAAGISPVQAILCHFLLGMSRSQVSSEYSNFP